MVFGADLKIAIRLKLYEKLALAFSMPDGAEAFLSMSDEFRKLLHSLGIDYLDLALKDLTIGDIAELKVEYTRLFYGPGRIPALPYESVYREGRRVYGECTTAVVEAYRIAGLSISSDFNDLPDHISTELEFMFFLVLKEKEAFDKGDFETAEPFRARQEEFLREHLIQWICHFCDEIINNTRLKFYSALAILAKVFIISDFFRLNKVKSDTVIPACVKNFTYKMLDMNSQHFLKSANGKFKAVLLHDKAVKISRSENLFPLYVHSKQFISVVSILKALDNGADGVIVFDPEKRFTGVLYDVKKIACRFGIDEERIAAVNSTDSVKKVLVRMKSIGLNSLNGSGCADIDEYSIPVILRTLSKSSGKIPDYRFVPKSLKTGIVTVDRKTCTACRSCAVRCPSKAIRLMTNGEFFKLAFNHKDCTLCGECARICISRSVRIRKFLDISAVINLSEKVLTVQKAVRCAKCFNPFVSEKEHNLIASKNNDKEYIKLLSKCPECRGA